MMNSRAVNDDYYEQDNRSSNSSSRGSTTTGPTVETSTNAGGAGEEDEDFTSMPSFPLHDEGTSNHDDDEDTRVTLETCTDASSSLQATAVSAMHVRVGGEEYVLSSSSPWQRCRRPRHYCSSSSRRQSSRRNNVNNLLEQQQQHQAQQDFLRERRLCLASSTLFFVGCIVQFIYFGILSLTMNDDDNANDGDHDKGKADGEEGFLVYITEWLPLSSEWPLLILLGVAYAAFGLHALVFEMILLDGVFCFRPRRRYSNHQRYSQTMPGNKLRPFSREFRLVNIAQSSLFIMAIMIQATALFAANHYHYEQFLSGTYYDDPADYSGVNDNDGDGDDAAANDADEDEYDEQEEQQEMSEEDIAKETFRFLSFVAYTLFFFSGVIVTLQLVVRCLTDRRACRQNENARDARRRYYNNSTKRNNRNGQQVLLNELEQKHQNHPTTATTTTVTNITLACAQWLDHLANALFVLSTTAMFVVAMIAEIQPNVQYNFHHITIPTTAVSADADAGEAVGEGGNNNPSTTVIHVSVYAVFALTWVILGAMYLAADCMRMIVSDAGRDDDDVDDIDKDVNGDDDDDVISGSSSKHTDNDTNTKSSGSGSDRNGGSETIQSNTVVESEESASSNDSSFTFDRKKRLPSEVTFKSQKEKNKVRTSSIITAGEPSSKIELQQRHQQPQHHRHQPQHDESSSSSSCSINNKKSGTWSSFKPWAATETSTKQQDQQPTLVSDLSVKSEPVWISSSSYSLMPDDDGGVGDSHRYHHYSLKSSSAPSPPPLEKQESKIKVLLSDPSAFVPLEAEADITYDSDQFISSMGESASTGSASSSDAIESSPSFASNSESTAFVFHDDDPVVAARGGGGSCCSVSIHCDSVISSDSEQQEIELIYSPPKQRMQQQQKQQTNVAPLYFDDSESDIESSSKEAVNGVYRNKMTFAEAKQSLALIRKTHSPTFTSSPPRALSNSTTNAATAFIMPPARTMLTIETGDFQHSHSDNSKTTHSSIRTTSPTNDVGYYPSTRTPKSKLAMEMHDLQRIVDTESATKADLRRLLDIQSAKTASERNSSRQPQPFENLVESCQQQQQHDYHYKLMEEYAPS